MQLRRVMHWISGRAWSRAGAIALTMSSGTPRRALVMSTRVMLLAAGSLTIAGGVAVMLWNSFGPGPLDVFVNGLADTTGLPLTLAYWIAFAGVMALAFALGKRPGPGTMVTPFILGPTVQSILSLVEDIEPPDALIGQAVIHLIAIGVVGIGAGALISSGLGAGTGELLASAASDRYGRPESHVRLGFELGWLTIGVLLGGPIGIGTVFVAGLIGPAVAGGHRLVDGWVSASRRRIKVVTAPLTGRLVAVSSESELATASR